MAAMGWHIHGHTWAAEMLERQIANGKLRHAYLFSGPNGVGRRTLALRFAQAVNCPEKTAPGEPCGACQTCRQIERMQYADLAVVQGEDGAALKAGNYRVALLLNFQEATAGAQNAFLKTLEEPNPKVLLLLTVDDPENVLPTISSRCELLRLRPMAAEDLTEILIKENKLSREKAQLIAHISAGRVGYAKQMADDPEKMKKRTQWMNDLLELLPTGRIARIQYSEKQTSPRKIKRPEAKRRLLEGLPYWLSFWRDVLLVGTKSTTPVINIDLRDAIEATAQSVTVAEAARAVSVLEHTFKRLPTANLQLMLDNILLDWPCVIP